VGFAGVGNSFGVHTPNDCCKVKSPPWLHAKPKEPRMKSHITKRSIVIAGHKTSVSLEEQFWRELKDIAQRQQITEIKTRQQGNLSSSIRLFVLGRLRTQISEFSQGQIGMEAVVLENEQHHA
jgi:predicted DNA-binding ribbon-helix-helix protein